MIRPRNETENFETLIEQTHGKAEETFEFRLAQPKQTFAFTPSTNLCLDTNWMLGLISLKIYNFIFNKSHENNKFQLYTNAFDEFSFTELKDELEEIFKNSNISHEHLQDKTIRPRIISAFNK